MGITHRIDSKNTLQAYGYYARDRFSFGGDTTFRYGNLNASLVWKHRTEKGRLQISAGYDRYANRISAHEWAFGAYDLDTKIQQAFLRADRKRTLSDAHELAWGIHLTGYSLNPGTIEPFGVTSGIATNSLDLEQALEPAVYVSDTWKPSEAFSVEAGTRLTGFYSRKGNALYGFPDLRLAFKYSPEDNLSFKAGLNTLSQYIHLISNTSAVSPMDTWKLSDDRIKPTWGWQAAAGTYWTELNTGIDFSMEAYFKQSYRALDYLPGATLMMNPNLADDLVPVKGRSYGVELMARKTTGKITGWASYSYSRARLKEMGDRGLEAIAHGEHAPVQLLGQCGLLHRAARYGSHRNVLLRRHLPDGLLHEKRLPDSGLFPDRRRVQHRPGPLPEGGLPYHHHHRRLQRHRPEESLLGLLQGHTLRHDEGIHAVRLRHPDSLYQP